MRTLFLLPVIFLFWCGLAVSQDLGGTALPTEDEALDALRNDDITYEQYAALLDLIQNGLDSTNLYLLDHFPDLLYVADSLQMKRSMLQQDQVDLVQSYIHNKGSYCKYRATQPIEEGQRSSWRMTSRVQTRENLRLQFSLSKYLGGDQTFNTRSVEYLPDSGLVSKFTVGTFTQKFGLGTVIGYRGKLLGRDTSLSTESFLYPNYGGYNGLSAEIRHGSFTVQPMFSVWRDEEYRLSTGATMISRPKSLLSPALIFGATRLEQRSTEEHITDFKTALSTQINIFSYKVATELTYQGSFNRGFSAAVIEATKRVEGHYEQWTAWWYADRFLDFTAGSRSAMHSHHVDYADANFELSTRRVGQVGAMYRGASAGEHWRLNIVLGVSAYSTDTIYGEHRLNLQYSLTSHWALIGDFRRKLTYSKFEDEGDLNQEYVLQFGVAYTNHRLRARINYGSRADAAKYDEYHTLAGRVIWKSPSMGTISFWMNISQIIDGDRINRSYLYLQHEQPLTANLGLLTKTTYFYGDNHGENGEFTLIGQLEARW